MKYLTLLLIGWWLALASSAGASGPDFVNQHREWEHTSSELNGAYLNVSYIDQDDPDSSFDHTTSAAWVKARGDSATGWNEVILIDLVWDSLFGYGVDKIADPAQVDSTLIDSAWLWVTIPNWSQSDYCTVTVYRLHPDIGYDGVGLNPCWSAPGEGESWSGAGFSRADLIGADSTQTEINALTQIALPIDEIFQRFADSTGRRTGIAITVVTGQADSLAAFWSEANNSGDNSRMSVEIWWSEYGVQSTAIDSQLIAVSDTYLDDKNANEEYNFGAANEMIAGSEGFLGSLGTNCKPLIDVANVADSLADNLFIDSARFHFYITDQSAGARTLSCYKTVRWWLEGDQDGASDDCGADWLHAVHGGGGGEGGCAAQHSWGTNGCNNTTNDREGSTFATVSIPSSSAWYVMTVPDSIAQGMYDNREINKSSQTNFTGVALVCDTEAGKYVNISSTEAGSYNPFWVFYWTAEVAPVAGRSRPASIDQVVTQGAWIK